MARREGERWSEVSRTAGRALVAVDGERAVGIQSPVAVSEKLAPGRARLGPSDALLCRGGVVERRAVRSWRASWAAGDRRRRSRSRPRLSTVRRALQQSSARSRSIAGRRDASRSRGVRGNTLGLEDRMISLGAFRSAGPMRRFAPSVVCVPKPGRPDQQGPTPFFFRRCRGASFVSGASAGLFSSPRTSLHREQKNCRRPSSALLRPAPTPYGRRTRVQVRSQGQAFRDRTEGNKPASGRRNPRPRKSGSRS